MEKDLNAHTVEPPSAGKHCGRIDIDMETCLQYMILCKCSTFVPTYCWSGFPTFYNVTINVFCFCNLEKKNAYILLKMKYITLSFVPHSGLG